MEKQKVAKNHPIQLLKVDIKELRFKSHATADPQYELPAESVLIGVGHNDVDEEQSTFTVGIQVELGEERSETIKYYAKIELLGHFHVDVQNFSTGNLGLWAQQNAPIILLPFLREHLYAVTLRAGFKPFILPLVQVPTK